MSETTTKATHTAGPWTCELARVLPKSPIFGFAIKADGKIPFVASAGVSHPNHCLIVPEEFRKEVTTGFTEDEVECNARLIAAAPDLLEALKGVVRVADRNTVEFEAARAAIAKAGG